MSYWINYEKKVDMGDWMLFTNWKTKEVMFALIVGHTVWDQALVIEFVREWRAKDIDRFAKQGYEEDKRVEHIEFWTNDIIVHGHWKSKPSLKELIKAYRSLPPRENKQSE